MASICLLTAPYVRADSGEANVSGRLDDMEFLLFLANSVQDQEGHWVTEADLESLNLDEIESQNDKEIDNRTQESRVRETTLPQPSPLMHEETSL